MNIPAQSNQRKSARQKSRINGSIYFNAIKLSDCVIKDISKSGMRLYVSRNAWLPLEFHVESEVFDEWVAVKKIWHHGEYVGVEISV